MIRIFFRFTSNTQRLCNLSVSKLYCRLLPVTLHPCTFPHSYDEYANNNSFLWEWSVAQHTSCSSSWNRIILVSHFSHHACCWWENENELCVSDEQRRREARKFMCGKIERKLLFKWKSFWREVSKNVLKDIKMRFAFSFGISTRLPCTRLFNALSVCRCQRNDDRINVRLRGFEFVKLEIKFGFSKKAKEWNEWQNRFIIPD